jgi:peptidoglycan LD-endopeptidase CwlK
MEIIVDSGMSCADALAQNPQNLAPVEILESLVLIQVSYYGFDSKMHSGQIVVHKNVATEVILFFEKAAELKFPIAKVVPISDSHYLWDDEVSCCDNNTSAYNYRLIAGTNKISKHARGLAFDVNPVQNIFVRYDKNLNETYRLPPNGAYEPLVPGTLTQEHELVILMKNLGWTWGGDWKPEEGRVDYQHFEKSL